MPVAGENAGSGEGDCPRQFWIRFEPLLKKIFGDAWGIARKAAARAAQSLYRRRPSLKLTDD